jgi:hypothetical protein
LPFLRFTRDKRGYETTSLVHAVRRQGRSRQRVLYWFRTPPDVKVGRPALDEEAIRWIEEHNPDIEFNWQKILEAKPEPAPVEARNRRSRRDGRDRPKRPPEKTPGVPEITSGEGALEQPEALEEMDAMEEPSTGEEQGTVDVPEEELVEAIEQLTHPDAEEKIEAPLTAVEQVIGREQLIRLRARFAELQARITERGGDAERVAALRLAAEPLNPDTWVTEEEARAGLEKFEPKIRDLRTALGLRRRRRSRRGRGRRGGGGPAPTESSPESSKESTD